jgi:hypothetical protein
MGPVVSTEYESTENVYVDRDDRGAVRSLSHFGAPFFREAETPQMIATEYLQRYAGLLEVPDSAMTRLGLAPDAAPTGDPVEFRYGGQKQQDALVTVAFDQTVLGLPIWQAGVAVQVATGPSRVVSSQSTAHLDVDVDSPDQAALDRAQQIDEATLAAVLGFGDARPESLAIQRRDLVVYEYDRDGVQRDGGPGDADSLVADDTATQPRLALPAVPDSIVDGRHYVCVKVDFALAVPSYGLLNWVVMVEAGTLTALYLRPFVDEVTGLVFDIDPVTTDGGPAPSSTSQALNQFRAAQVLLGLTAPVAGVQSLTGDNVALIDGEPPVVAPPTQPEGSNFDFDARTDEFAAVNAYQHCDRFFRLADSLGFSRSGFFAGTTFPSSVDHRGKIGNPTTPGVEINAHCVGTSGGTGIAITSFALADVGDPAKPIGLACDYRVVLHELAGHGVLYGHVNGPNFRFAHSAGDSVAAIVNDPGSRAGDRFMTFPWINGVISRRHDRLPSEGWGFAGKIAASPFDPTLDRGGYNNEQILSSTLFRLYRSIGGDAADVDTRRFAARLTVYLILKAISTLTPATNPSAGQTFARSLMNADADDWPVENLTGGAYRKVIRWAFEKQGAFQTPGRPVPNNDPGDPSAIDVYIEDGRGGEYTYQPDFSATTSIWNRRADDSGTEHQDPVLGETNFAYVIIKNRGTEPATDVTVQGFHADADADLVYPTSWEPMATASLTAPTVAPNSTAEVVVGPFTWVPRHAGQECMLMVVSAPGDETNIDDITPGGTIPHWRLVPNDNNIGQRNVATVANP